MSKKFALITDEKTFSTDKGWRIITYSSAWDNGGWTALKELGQEAAELIGGILRTEGYVIAYDLKQLERLMKTAQDENYMDSLRLAARES